MFRWIRTLARRFALYLHGRFTSRPHFGGQHQRPKVRLPRRTKKLNLEALEGRVVPSGTPTAPLPASLPVVVQASPPTMPAVSDPSSAAGQFVHLATILQDDFSNAEAMLSQEVAQVRAYVIQRWDNVLGIEPITPSQPAAGSGSGSGSGTMMTAHNALNQQAKSVLSQSGSGTGSGANTNVNEAASTKVVGGNSPKQGMSPMVGSGSGSGGGGGGGGGPGSNDSLLWLPQAGSNASLPQNWFDMTKEQQGLLAPTSTTPVYFSGTRPSSNKPIEWTAGLSAASVTLENGYNAQMTIDAGQSVVDDGTFTEDAKSNLYITFGDNASFEIDGGGTITNMTLDGYPSGRFVLGGGTTMIAGNPGAGNPVYADSIGVQFQVTGSATLNDQGYNSLQFTNSNLQLLINGGTMLVFYGTGNGVPLIDAGGRAGDYIYVSDGFLKYLGKGPDDQGNGAITDTFTMPVLVDGGGVFWVTSATNVPSGGKLIVQGTVPGQIQNASVYMTFGASTVELSSGATLECDNGYYQEEGTLKTLDATNCTLQAGPASQGTVNIASGVVWIANQQDTYGTLNVNAANLNFNGELQVSIQGYTLDPNNPQPGPSDHLNVTGALNLDQPGSSLYVFNYGTLAARDYWIFINASNMTSTANPIDFGSKATQPQANLNYWPNTPKQGQYEITT